MGDSILMKKLFLGLLLIQITINANELEWVDEQINAIKPPRTGIKDADISTLKDPFIFFNKKSSKDSTTTKKSAKTKTTTKSSKVVKTSIAKNSSRGFTLDAILNKSALINGKWYKLGDIIDTYTLQEVNKNDIVLVKKGFKAVFLSTETKNRTLQYKNK